MSDPPGRSVLDESKDTRGTEDVHSVPSAARSGEEKEEVKEEVEAIEETMPVVTAVCLGAPTASTASLLYESHGSRSGDVKARSEQARPSISHGGASLPPHMDRLPGFKDQTRDENAQILSGRFVKAMDPQETARLNQNQNETPPVSLRQSLSSFTTTSIKTESDTLKSLVQDGYPLGLIHELETVYETYPIRYWIVDNSGSMMTADCKRLVEGQPNRYSNPRCSRWDELKDTVLYHVNLAGKLGASTTFRLLNNPGGSVGPQEFSVNSQADVELAGSIMEKVVPDGVTPLTQHILQITERIEAVEEELVANGQKAVVVFATDGLPSDRYGESGDKVKEEFSVALKKLQSMPVWTIARLCTNDKAVVNFWSKLDCRLELSLESIDDFLNEAKEIQKMNPWLNYGMPLHRCREFGVSHRVFDLLDERQLTTDELMVFLELLFGKTAFVGAPDIHSDWSLFTEYFVDLVNREKKQWNPRTSKLEPWIDFRKLNQVYSKGGMMGSIRSMSWLSQGKGK